MHLTTPLGILMPEENAALRREARDHSRFMLLEALPVSPAASAFVSFLINTVIGPYQQARGQLRPSTVTKVRKATGPFLAGLLSAAHQGRWASLATRNSDLVTYPGGRAAFGLMRSALGADGWLEELRGYGSATGLSIGPAIVSARTSFRPTPKLLTAAQGHGIELRGLSGHFASPRAPATPKANLSEGWLVARGRRVDGAQAKSVPIAPDDLKAQAILLRMETLNHHLLSPGHVDGIVFAGLKRIFSNADQPGFDWQWGGRFYSMRRSDHYERLQHGSATRGRLIRLDGEEVIEVDISASHLTIMHGLLGLPFDSSADPYDLGGPERREDAKWFITRAMGKSDPDIGGRRYGWAREAAIRRYPFLRDLATLGIGTLDLQYHEAEIMMMAMEELMDQHGIGFLPVHDALMVARSKRDLAADVLKRAIRRYFVERLGMPAAPVPMVHWCA